MIGLVIAVAVIGVAWFLGARYVVANRRWFNLTRDQLARETEPPWSASRSPRRTRVFAQTLWQVLWAKNAPGMFAPSSDPEIDAARREAVRRWWIYVRFFVIFGAFFLVLAVIILIVLAVHSVA